MTALLPLALAAAPSYAPLSETLKTVFDMEPSSVTPETRCEIMAALLDVIYHFGFDTPEHKLVLVRYDALRDANIAELGADADVCKIDPDLAVVFANCYKSDTGINPRGEFSYEYVRKYLDDRREAEGE
jgi:hypothetical protein